MSDQISRDEIKQVLNYIDKIKEYDRNNQKRIFSITSVVWAFSFFYAGIMDLVLFQLDAEYLVVIPWLLCSIGGGILSIFITFSKDREQPLTEEVARSSSEFSSYNFKILALIAISWLATSIIGFLQLYWLIIPLVAFSMGVTMIGRSLQDTELSTLGQLKILFSPNSRIIFVGTVSIMIGIINVVLYLLIGPIYHQFMGILFGTSVGLAFANAGIRMRNL